MQCIKNNKPDEKMKQFIITEKEIIELIDFIELSPIPARYANPVTNKLRQLAVVPAQTKESATPAQEEKKD